MVPIQSKHSKRTATKNRTRLFKPGIKKAGKINKSKYGNEIKCRTNPGDVEFTTYEIPVAYFRDKTPKEWLLFKK